MTTQVFGEVSWQDNANSFDKKTNSKDLFLKLDEGENEVRLITAPFQYMHHRVKLVESDKYGQKINCSKLNGSCMLCDELNDRPKARWLVGVISRKTGAYKILDISWAVFSQIQKYAKNTKSWGDPMTYDLNIIVDKNGGATGYYSVQPLPKEPLSAADQVIKDNADLDDLKRRVVPITPEKVKERVDRIKNGDTSFPSKTGTTTKVSVKTLAETTDDDSDSVFPAYDAE